MLKGSTPITADQYLDSRDIIARIEYLSDERAELEEAVKTLEAALLEATDDNEQDDERIFRLREELEDAQRYLEAFDAADGPELNDLLDLQNEAEGCPDWFYGETLIREDVFIDYVEQLAEDTGAIDRNASWPLTHIDWEAAADELRYDYTEVEYDGHTYLILC